MKPRPVLRPLVVTLVAVLLVYVLCDISHYAWSVRRHGSPRVVRPGALSSPNKRGQNVAYRAEVEVIVYPSDEEPSKLPTHKKETQPLNEQSLHRVLDKAKAVRAPTPMPKAKA